MLRTAKDLLLAKDYVRALQAARWAETTAIALDEGYNAYQKAVEAFQRRLGEMRRFGLPTESLEALLPQAEERIAAGTPEDGVSLPDYAHARAILEQGAREGGAVLEKAQAASNAVFVAELAIEGLLGMPGPSDPDAFESGCGTALETELQGAIHRLAVGDFDQAIRIAGDIGARANRLRGEFIEASRALTATAALLAELRDKGVATGRLGSQVAIVRDVLSRGVVEPAAGMARRLFEDARVLGETFQRASTALAEAVNRYSALVREGFLSVAADRAIIDARRGIRDGGYGTALRHLEDARAAIAKAESEREAIARSLEENRARIAGADAPFLPDAREILGRAEKEYLAGDFSGSSEDLVLAKLLLGPSSRSRRSEG